MLWLLCGAVCTLALWLQAQTFMRVVKRMRWLFVSVFFIYAYGTPGEYLSYFPVSVAPTIEGVSAGLLQIAKLLCALAALNVLFAKNSQQDLMAGLYMLLSPLRLLGLDVARFSARLLLTLDYVEELALDKQKLSIRYLSQEFFSQEHFPENKVIELQLPAFNTADKIGVIFFVVSVAVLVML